VDEQQRCGHPRNSTPPPRPPTRTRGPAAAVHEFPRLPHPPATHLPPIRGSGSPTTHNRTPATRSKSQQREGRRGQPSQPAEKEGVYLLSPPGPDPRRRGREESPTPAAAGSGAGNKRERGEGGRKGKRPAVRPTCRSPTASARRPPPRSSASGCCPLLRRPRRSPRRGPRGGGGESGWPPPPRRPSTSSTRGGGPYMDPLR
jgi:hypothetical protein